MKRLMMLILALILAILPASGMAELAQEVLLPDEGELQADAEVRHALVKSLFMAAAGTDFESEAKLIEELKEQEELSEKLQSSLPPADTGIEAESEAEGEEPLTPREERRAYLAQYRADTLPWLLLAFDPEAEIAGEASDESADIPAETVPADEIAGQNSADPAETPTEEPIWTPETAYARFAETDTGRNYLALTESLGAEDAESCLAITQELCRAWMEEVDHGKLSEINGDYACWLYCADTQIDYPVVQCADNSYYLKRLFNGAKNSGGTLFIERGRRHAVRAVGHQMRERFARGEAVGLFPEGTTSTGLDVAPFHTSLFEPAVRAGADIQPVALRFLHKGRRTTRYAFVGDQTLLHNLWNLLTATGTAVELEFGPVTSAAECAELGRVALAARSERMIREAVTAGLHAP